MLFIHFLRLVRLGNLLVIGATMCVIQVFITSHGNSTIQSTVSEELTAQLTFGEKYLSPFSIDLNFLLLIISVVLIAAAGNIINDYFDVKADRVNKPEKLVVGKYIKRRWAIMFNWIFNALGFGLAAYLSYIHSNWWIVLIAFLTINFLWFYSALYKRKIIVGNIIIAVLVGIVPIYVLIYNLPLEGFGVYYRDSFIDFGSLFILEVVVSISVIAFMINLMREIIKDMADIRGDLLLAARTVPIALGFKRTKLILSILLIPLLALMIYYIYNMQHYNELVMTLPGMTAAPGDVLFENILTFSIFVAVALLFCALSFIVLLSSNTRKKYLLSSNLLKLAMLFGMASPLFL